MARRFFFICGGLLCLAVALKLGATMAVAQAASLDVADAGSCVYVGAVGRNVYLASQVDFPESLNFFRSLGAVPGSSPIVAIHFTGNASYPATAMLENADVYVCNGSSWNLAGNILGGGPTPAKVTTWGSLKSRYR